MNTILIGSMIKKRRIELGITQEQLCEGICEPPSLSKIENGKQRPTKEKLDALMARMGISQESYYSLTSQREYEIYTLKYKINEYNLQKDHHKTQELLEELKKIVNAEDKLNRQFILRAEATMGSALGKDPKEMLELLQQAIYLTHPTFNEKKLDRFLFSFDELKIINSIAVLKLNLGLTFEGISLLYNLLECLEADWMDIEERARTYPLVAYNLSKQLGKQQQYIEAIAIADKGIHYCRQYDKAKMLTQLVFNKGYCLYELGKKEESIPYIKQAYYALKLLSREKEALSVLDYAKTQLNLTLE